MSSGDLDQLRVAEPAQRDVRNEDDIFARAIVDDCFVPAVREVVGVLHRGDGQDSPSTLDLIDPYVRHTAVLDLAAVLVRPDNSAALPKPYPNCQSDVTQLHQATSSSAARGFTMPVPPVLFARLTSEGRYEMPGRARLTPHVRAPNSRRARRAHTAGARDSPAGHDPIN